MLSCSQEVGSRRMDLSAMCMRKLAPHANASGRTASICDLDTCSIVWLHFLATACRDISDNPINPLAFLLSQQHWPVACPYPPATCNGHQHSFLAALSFSQVAVPAEYIDDTDLGTKIEYSGQGGFVKKVQVSQLCFLQSAHDSSVRGFHVESLALHRDKGASAVMLCYVVCTCPGQPAAITDCRATKALQ